MRRNVLLLVSLLAFSAFVSSCHSISREQRAKDQLISLYQDVEQNGDSYSTDDWQRFAQEYQRLDSLTNLYEYSSEEKYEIGQIKGKCYAYMIAGAIGEKLKEVGIDEEALGKVKGFLDAFGLDGE